MKRIYDLIDESILMPFINELSPTRPNGPMTFPNEWNESDERLNVRGSKEALRQRSRSRRKPSPQSHSSDPGSSSNNSFWPTARSQPGQDGKGRPTAGLIGTDSSNSGDIALTDDSASLPSPSESPMTPPTTPPGSETGGGSPRLRTDNTWKKMMSRLGTKKKSSSKMDLT